jgi:hypothetical protein
MSEECLITPAEFLKWCREEIEHGGNWRFRIHHSFAFKELSKKYENMDQVIALAEKQVLGSSDFERLRVAIDEVTEKPLEFHKEVSPEEVAKFVEFRLNVFDHSKDVEKVLFRVGHKRFCEFVLKTMEDLGRVPLEMR